MGLRASLPSRTGTSKNSALSVLSPYSSIISPTYTGGSRVTHALTASNTKLCSGIHLCNHVPHIPVVIQAVGAPSLRGSHSPCVEGRVQITPTRASSRLVPEVCLYRIITATCDGPNQSPGLWPLACACSIMA